MKPIRVILILSLFVITACGGNTNGKLSAEEMKEIIKQKEDSLVLLQKENQLIPQKKHYELIHSLLDFSRTYPKDTFAPVCLDKAHMAYSGLGVYFKAIECADTLIEKYPDYVNRPMILESQAANHDIFNQPRDTAKVRYYYTLLLKENPGMNKQKRKDIEMRLKYLGMNIEEYIEFKAKGGKE